MLLSIHNLELSSLLLVVVIVVYFTAVCLATLAGSPTFGQGPSCPASSWPALGQPQDRDGGGAEETGFGARGQGQADRH